MSQSIITSSLVYLAIRSVIGYENAYDLLERRNQRFYEPRYLQSKIFYNDGYGFFTNNRRPPLEYSNVNSHFSKFGNGYDNLGNGIPVKHFHPFRRQLTRTWQFERRPYRERTFDNFDLDGYPAFKRPHYDYKTLRSGGYYPSVHSPISSEVYESEFGSRENTDFIQNDRFTKDNEDKKHKKSEEFHQRNQEGVNMDSSNKEKTGEQLHTDQMGENKSSLRSNKVIKKGRTTKGFAVHHHKDETGNSTTFFDEISNFGGQSDLRDIADGFGSRKTLEQTSYKDDEKHYKGNEGQTTDYGSGLFVGNQKLEKDISSLGGHQDSQKKFHIGNENEDLGSRKTYQYQNGDKFEYTEPHFDNYY